MEGVVVYLRENVLKSLEAGAQKTPDNLSGFLSGFWYNRNLHISGFRVSTDCSHKQFEQEFDNASSYLPAGIRLCGLFLKTNQANVPLIIRNVFKAVLPSTSILRECFDSDQIMILAVSDSPGQNACYWYSFEKQDIIQTQMKVTDGSETDSLFITYRIQGSLPFGFEDAELPDSCLSHIQSEMQRLKDLVASQTAVFRITGSSLLLYHRQPEDWPQSDGYANWPAKRLLECSVDAEGKEARRRRQNEEDSSLQSVLSVSLMFQSTGKVAADSCITCIPIIHHDHKNFRYVSLKLPLDVLAVTSCDLPIHILSAVFVEGIIKQLDSMAECLYKHSRDGLYKTPKPHHFQPSDVGHSITVVLPEGVGEDRLVSARKGLHHQFLLPLNRPAFRRSLALTFSKDQTFDGRLLDVHLGLGHSGVTNGRRYVVRGHYAYYHYMQDGIDDNGWGCAYRSLQTLASWLHLQGYTEKSVPSHTEIQKCLVAVGDKEESFIGSRKWIGSVEVGYVIDHLFAVSCKMLHVSSGAEMATKARELANHFETQETPVMIGGGVLAHTILGVDWNEATGDTKFLILDPHYTGGENLKIIQDKGWCGWKGPDFWDKTAYYNMCMPQRPHEF